MNHQEAKKHAQHFFKTYPKVDKFHITTDGQVFEEQHQADSHAQSLDKKKPVVHVVERHEAPEAESKKPEAGGKEPEVTATPEMTQEEKDKEAKGKEAIGNEAIDKEAADKEAAEKKAAAIQKGKETKAKNAAAKAGK